jgi:hypothetical protein
VHPGFFLTVTARSLHVHLNDAGALRVLGEPLHDEASSSTALTFFLKRGSVIMKQQRPRLAFGSTVLALQLG